VYAVGGSAAAADRAATPLVGSDRYATAALVAAHFFTLPTTVGVASGANFPDALAGGAFLAHSHAPLLLAAPTSLTSATDGFLRSAKPLVVDVFGGPTSLSDGVVAAASGAAGGAPN
jgi:hypothetical protein